MQDFQVKFVACFLRSGVASFAAYVVWKVLTFFSKNTIPMVHRSSRLIALGMAAYVFVAILFCWYHKDR